MDTQDQKFSSFVATPPQHYGVQPQQQNYGAPSASPPQPVIVSTHSKRRLMRKQEGAYLGGAIIITTMGLDMALSLCIRLFRTQWILFGLTSGEQLHAIISWNIAFIVGAAVAAFVVRRVTKKVIYQMAAFVLIVSGALKIPSWELADGPIASRYLAGLAHGAAFLTTIIHTSEVVSSQIRGRALGGLSLLLTCSLFLGFGLVNLMVFVYDDDLYADQVLGIVELIAGIVATALTFFTFIESPVYLLEKNQSSMAISKLAQLRFDHISSQSMANEIEDLQAHINEGNNNGDSIKSVVRGMLIRGVYSVSTLTIINEFAFVYLFSDLQGYGLFIFYAVRLLSEIISISLIDKLGRRPLLMTSLLTSGVFAIAFGSMFFGILVISDLTTLCALMLVYSICVGIGLGTVSVTYLGESFSSKRKSLWIFLALLVEHGIQIIAMVALWYTESNEKSLSIPIGAIQIVACVLCFFMAPETKGMSLRQSRNALQ